MTETLHEQKTRLFIKFPGNRIIHYKKGAVGTVEQFVFVRDIDDHGRLWVTNYPAPLNGTLSRFVHEKDLDNIVDFRRVSIPL